MRIGTPYESELEWVDSKLALERQTIFERRARVLRLVIGILVASGAECGTIPSLVVRKLVVRRKKRVGFAIALVLRHFDKGLASCTLFRVGLVDRISVRVFERKHQPAGNVRVMRDRQNASAGLLLVFPHKSP